jgi:hypothetical protein
MGERLERLEQRITDRMSLRQTHAHNSLRAGFNVEANGAYIEIGALSAVRGLVHGVQRIIDGPPFPYLKPPKAVDDAQLAHDDYSSFQYDTGTSDQPTPTK